MENLNKENFWNALYEQFPNGMKLFCEWIDKYKLENDWGKLFHPNLRATQPKFHDLPLAMQIGIWIEFASLMCGVHEWEIEDLANYDWKGDITETIALLNVDGDTWRSQLGLKPQTI